MEETDDSPHALSGDLDTEIKEMMGLFDSPAFARRGVEVEETLRRMHDRCRRARDDRLDMVRLRLKQWGQVANGPDDQFSVFAQSISNLWPLSGSEPPQWAGVLAHDRRRLAIAR